MQGHHISDETIQLAQQHAHKSTVHGQQIEEMAADLRKSGKTTSEQAMLIEQTGREIQLHAQAAMEHATAAKENLDRSTTEYSLAVQEHAEAAKKHVQATRALLEIGNQLNQDSSDDRQEYS